MVTQSLARTLPNRFVMFRNSSIQLLLLHRVRNLDLPADNSLSRCFDGLDCFRRDQIFVVLIDGIPDAVVFKAVSMNASKGAVLYTVFDNLVDGIVHALDHARQNETRLDPVLVGIDSDSESLRVSCAVFAVLFDRIECAEARIARRGKDDIRTFFNLSFRQFLSFHGIVPCGVRYTDVVRDNPDPRIDGHRALLIPDLELSNERDIHPADKSHRAGFGSQGGNHADEVGAFMFFENQRSDVRKLAHTIDNREIELWIILRNRVDDRRMVKAHANNQVVAAFGKRPHRRLNGGGVTRLDVAQNDRKIFSRSAYTLQRRGVEGMIVLPADVKNDSDMDLGRVVGGITGSVASGKQCCTSCKYDTRPFHSVAIVHRGRNHKAHKTRRFLFTS